MLVFKYIPKGYDAMAFFPFILLKNKGLKQDRILINHESIHLKQQIELLWILFFLWYGIEFLIRLFQYKNTYQAYRNISFEREAYQHENDLHYLKKRKVFAFWRCL
ncbi:hypothetical protein AB4865_04120 [Capnocytophaga sp. ARDL2]|uniref:hypothetical protein n=1 Tax=Capnocytophaga sp. ARDL2 TaxID=3238809 RepID=UPI0035578139